MNRTFSPVVWLAGLQWLFFMFANTVVIPISIGAAFMLEQVETVSAIQRSFIFTGVACILQGLFGHRYALMEGQSGLWWGVILSLAATASTLNVDLSTVGGSIAVGAIISGVVVSILSIFGLGSLLKKWFTPVVMFVFLLLLANQLLFTFFKGMVGLQSDNHIVVRVAFFSIILATITIFLNVKGSKLISNLSLLIGMILGWIGSAIFFEQEVTTSISTTPFLTLFPWGKPSLELGIILTVVLTGLINTTNTIATLKGAEDIYETETTPKQYQSSLFLSGVFTSLAAMLGLVPYAPYASSLGFLQTTEIKERLPFFIGSILFIMLGIISPLSAFFSTIPYNVGSTVLFVAYLQLFRSALKSISGLQFSPKTIYRIALPTMLGMSIMNLPKEAFTTIPTLVQPLVSNGLLIGILVALLMEFIYYPRDNKKEKDTFQKSL